MRSCPSVPVHLGRKSPTSAASPDFWIMTCRLKKPTRLNIHIPSAAVPVARVLNALSKLSVANSNSPERSSKRFLNVLGCTHWGIEYRLLESRSILYLYLFILTRRCRRLQPALGAQIPDQADGQQNAQDDDAKKQNGVF